MLSIELIRKDPDYVRKALEFRGEEDPLSHLLELDAERRQGIAQGDELRSQRNQVSRRINLTVVRLQSKTDHIAGSSLHRRRHHAVRRLFDHGV